jgi:hypothetical protein
MTSVERISAVAPMTGYGHTEVRKSLDAGKVAPEVKEVIVQRNLEQKRKIVSQAYESERETDEFS